MFSLLHANFTAMVTFGDSYVKRIAKQVPEKNEDTLIIKQEPLSDHFGLGQIQLGYTQDFDQFFASIYALGGYALGSSEYMNHYFQAGGGVNFGVNFHRFSLFGGGGAVMAGIQNSKFQSNMNPISQMYIENFYCQKPTFFYGVQAFIAGVVGYQLTPNLNLIGQYQYFFNIKELSDNVFINGIGKRFNLQDRIVKPFILPNKELKLALSNFSSHCISVGIHYTFLM
jgi:hypothetical protein